jgi:hypothetical protein
MQLVFVHRQNGIICRLDRGRKYFVLGSPELIRVFAGQLQLWHKLLRSSNKRLPPQRHPRQLNIKYRYFNNHISSTFNFQRLAQVLDTQRWKVGLFE